MHLRAVRPLASAADVTRRERSWVVTAGSRHFSFTRVDYRASFAEGHRIVDAVPRGWRPTTIIGVMLGLVGGATMVGLAVNSSRADAGYHYVVSVPLPAAKPFAPKHAAAPHAGPVASAPRVAKAVVEQQTSPVEDGASSFTVDEMDVPPARAGSMSVALKAAMASGQLQQWSTPDGAERGFVVVGPVDAGEAGCRSVSILTRRDGDNQVERRRECNAPGAAAR